MRIGTPPDEVSTCPTGGTTVEEVLWRQFVLDGPPERHTKLGTGRSGPDVVMSAPTRRPVPTDYMALFCECLADAISEAVGVAGGVVDASTGAMRRSPRRQALDWFISSYPLIGGIAAAFRLVEDHDTCVRLDIT